MQFNEEHSIGNLILRPLRVNITARSDLFGGLDGYFRAFFPGSGEVAQSQTKKHVEGETELSGALSLRVYKQGLSLRIEYFDKDTFTPDDFIGSADFEISELLQKRFLESQEVLLADKHQRTSAGRILFDFEYYDDDDASEEDAADLDVYQKIKESEQNKAILQRFERKVEHELRHHKADQPENLLMSVPNFGESKLNESKKMMASLNQIVEDFQKTSEFEAPEKSLGRNFEGEQNGNPLRFSLNLRDLAGKVKDFGERDTFEDGQMKIGEVGKLDFGHQWRSNLSTGKMGQSEKKENPLKQSFKFKN